MPKLIFPTGTKAPNADRLDNIDSADFSYDHGTDENSFQLGTENSGPLLINDSGNLAIRNSDNTKYATINGRNIIEDGLKLDSLSNEATKVESSNVNGNIQINDEEINVYIHPEYNNDDIDINTTGSTIIDNISISSNELGHITGASASTRVLTLEDLGYVGDTDANKYIHPSLTPIDNTIDTSGIKIIDSITFESNSEGHITNYSTSTRDLPNATNTTKGVAQFSSNAFNVDGGEVSLSDVITIGSGGSFTITQDGGSWRQKIEINDNDDLTINRFEISEDQSSTDGTYTQLFAVDGHGDVFAGTNKVWHSGNFDPNNIDSYNNWTLKVNSESNGLIIEDKDSINLIDSGATTINRFGSDITISSINYYLNDVSGSGNGTVTFDMAGGFDNITWNSTHNNHDGTTSNTYHIDSDNNGPKLKNNNGTLEIRNADDDDYSDLIINDLIVKGTTTTINSETVTIDDNILVLNNSFTGSSPTENGGFEIERGSLTNASLIWDESNDYWAVGLKDSEYKIWHAGNDGSGSGLNADTIDNIQGNSLLRSDVYDTQSGGIEFTNGINVAGSIATELNTDGSFYYNDNNNEFRCKINGTWGKFWSDQDMGPGSGLDADTLDGVESSSFLRSDGDAVLTGNLTVDTGKLIFGNYQLIYDADSDAIEFDYIGA